MNLGFYRFFFGHLIIFFIFAKGNGEQDGESTKFEEKSVETKTGIEREEESPELKKKSKEKETGQGMYGDDAHTSRGDGGVRGRQWEGFRIDV